MDNINSYNVDQCQQYCKQLPFYSQIESDFDILRWEKIWTDDDYPLLHLTPRETYGSRIVVRDKTVLSMTPFFYLQYLLDKNPKEIYDLGCGWNIFKKYIPNIIGISPTTDIDNHGDIHDLVDNTFINGHRDYFESVFSINALHFRSLSELKEIIQEFVSIIAKGGRGYLALNLARIIEHSTSEWLTEEFKTNDPAPKEYDTYIRKILATVDVNYLILDVDLTVINEYMDGNIRLVVEK